MSDSERFDREVEALKDPTARALAKLGRWRKYSAAAVIMTEGDDGDQIFIVLFGKVRVFSSNALGKEVAIATYGPGELLGELSIENGVRSASVRTLEESHFSVLSRAALREAIVSDPDIALFLISSLVQRVQAATNSLRMMALMDVQERVVELLESLAVLQPDGTRLVSEHMTQQEMADRVGASRDMVQKVLAKLLESGHLVRVRRGYVIRGKLPRR